MNGIGGGYGSDAYGGISSESSRFFKDFYGNAVVSIEDSVKDFYGSVVVIQPVPLVPTNLFATDMQKGDLVRLTWDDDANYGYNVYQISPGARTKLNTYVITENHYYAGGLTTNTSYRFVVVGVNGAGTESADSNIVAAIPTAINLATDRYLSFTYSVKINGVARTDVILETVELGYGTSPSTSRFSIASDPNAAGLPVSEDDVEIIVNTISIFKGVIKNITKTITARSQGISFIAYSKSIYDTYTPVTWAYTLQILEEYGLNITDQNDLEARETIANFKGNYRLYYNMTTDAFEEYQLGTGYWNRAVAIGKNIIEYNISKDTLNKVNKVTVRGDRKRYKTNWQSLSFFTKVLSSYHYGTTTITQYYHQISAFNVSNIEVEALQSDGQPAYTFDPEVSVVPSDYGMIDWDDNTIEPKQKVLTVINPSISWVSSSTEIEYAYDRVGDKDIPVTAVIDLTARPVIYLANNRTGHAYRVGRKTDGSEDIDLGWVRYSLPHYTYNASYRVSYEYEEELPTEVTVGSGTPAITVTDTQYQIKIDYLNGTNNTTEVIAAMTARANAELAKVNRPVLSGTIKIIGDETFNLKTLVTVEGESLDVIRVVHDFKSGFTTQLELTNEKFRVNIPEYKEKQDSIYNNTLIQQSLSRIDKLAKELQQRINTQYTWQDKNTYIPKSSVSLYAD